MDYEKYVKGGIWWYKQNYVKNDDDNYFPVIIVSEASDPCGKCAVTIVPVKPIRIVNQDELNLQYVVPINIHEAGYVMCNELKTISTDKFEQYEGQCTKDKIDEINKMISQYLNLSLLGTPAVDTPAVYMESKPIESKSVVETKPEPEVKEEKEVKKPRGRRKSNFKKEIPDELNLAALINNDNSSNNKDNSTTYTTPKGNEENSVKSAYTQNKSYKTGGRGSGNGTPIYCLTNHKWYASMYAAMKDTGIDSRTIKAHLEKGDTSTINGYAFSYKKV